ncbi:MAG: hypothetical protein V3S02_00555, partial [Dehalococcoidales bacterium]
MRKNMLWVVVVFLMAVSLILVSCGQAEDVDEGPTEQVKEEPKDVEEEEVKQEEKEEVQETEEAVSSDVPRYGGTLRLALIRDITTFDDIVTIVYGPGQTNALTNETMWQGDWARGPAGGYGTAESDWLSWYDLFDHKAGMTAESWEWILDEENNKGTIIYQIRPGVTWALDPDNE